MMHMLGRDQLWERRGAAAHLIDYGLDVVRCLRRRAMCFLEGCDQISHLVLALLDCGLQLLQFLRVQGLERLQERWHGMPHGVRVAQHLEHECCRGVKSQARVA